MEKSPKKRGLFSNTFFAEKEVWRVIDGTKKKVFSLIIIAEIIILTIIGYIFGFETHNSLYALISMNIVFSTIVVFLIIILKDHKEELSAIQIPLIFDIDECSVASYLRSIIALLVLFLAIIGPIAIVNFLRST